jgi:hypothetical protein
MKTNDPNVICTIRDLEVAKDVSKAMGSALQSPVVIARTEGRGLFCLKPLKTGLSEAEISHMKQIAHGMRELFKLRRGVLPNMNLTVENGRIQNRTGNNGRAVRPVQATAQGGVTRRPQVRR